MKSITLRLSYGTKAIVESVMKNHDLVTGSKALNYIINKFEAMEKTHVRQVDDITNLLAENQELKSVIKHLRYLDSE